MEGEGCRYQGAVERDDIRSSTGTSLPHLSVKGTTRKNNVTVIQTCRYGP